MAFKEVISTEEYELRKLEYEEEYARKKKEESADFVRLTTAIFNGDRIIVVEVRVCIGANILHSLNLKKGQKVIFSYDEDNKKTWLIEKSNDELKGWILEDDMHGFGFSICRNEPTDFPYTKLSFVDHEYYANTKVEHKLSDGKLIIYSDKRIEDKE